MNVKNLSGGLAVALLAAIPLFGHLSELPIQQLAGAHAYGRTRNVEYQTTVNVMATGFGDASRRYK